MSILSRTRYRNIFIAVFIVLLIVALILLPAAIISKHKDMTDYTIPGFGIHWYLDPSDRRKTAIVHRLNILDYLYLLGYLDTFLENGLEGIDPSVLAYYVDRICEDYSSGVNHGLSEVEDLT